MLGHIADMHVAFYINEIDFVSIRHFEQSILVDPSHYRIWSLTFLVVFVLKGALGIYTVLQTQFLF